MVQKVPFTSIKASGKIASTDNANIDIEPHGTGDVLIGNFHFDADQSITNSNDNHVLTYDHSGGKISLEASSGGISDIVSDTSPQLGGSLDVNGNKIVSTSGADIDIEPNGTGDVLLGNFKFDADQSITNSNDNHVLTYDHSVGKISLEAVSGGGGGEGANIVTLNQNGNVTIHTGTARWYAPYNLTISKIDARVDTAPTGASINITIKKNGSSAATMSIAASAVKAENTTGFSMNEDDYLTVDTTQIGSTDPGTNLKLVFHYAQA